MLGLKLIHVSKQYINLDNNDRKHVRKSRRGEMGCWNHYYRDCQISECLNSWFRKILHPRVPSLTPVLFRKPYSGMHTFHSKTWWRHQMETFSAFLALCAGNSPVIGEFPAQRPVTRTFDVFFDLRLNERLSKQSWGWCFETPSRPLWRHSNEKEISPWRSLPGLLLWCFILS